MVTWVKKPVFKIKLNLKFYCSFVIPDTSPDEEGQIDETSDDEWEFWLPCKDSVEGTDEHVDGAGEHTKDQSEVIIGNISQPEVHLRTVTKLATGS